MATGSMVFTTSSFPSKADLKRGASVSPYFQLSSGNYPPTGATFMGATLHINGINVYVSSYIDFGNYGSASMSTQSGDASLDASLSGSSLLNFRGGLLSGTIQPNSSSYSGNVCNFRSTAGSLTIYYQYSNGSSGQLDKTTVMQNEQITLNISKSDPSFISIVTWRSSSGQESQQSIGTATSATFTIPADWATGSARCSLQTQTASGGYVSDAYYNFDVKLDTSVLIPSAGELSVALVQSGYIPSSWGLYVKGYSKCKVSLPGATAGANATMQSIELSCGAQSQSTQNNAEFTTSELSETGALTCSGRVVNNHGNEDSAQSKMIQVYDYFDPQLTSVMAYKCLANGQPSDAGAYIAVIATLNYASVGGKNSIMGFYANYKKTSDSSWSQPHALQSGATIIIGGDVESGASYQIMVTAIDQVQNLRGVYTIRTESVLTADVAIHCLDGGLNVSIGFRGTIPFAFQLASNWAFYHGDQEIDLNARALDELPTPGSQNTVKSGGMYTAIQALLPSPLSLAIAPSAWAYDGGKYVYVHQADVSAKTTIIASFTDEIGAQSIEAGILISPGAGEIIFQTDLCPTDTVNLSLLLQDIYEDASPFFLSKGRGGGDVPYSALSKLIVAQTVTNPTENLNMVFLMPNGDVLVIFDVLWGSYSNAAIAKVPSGFRPATMQSFSNKYYSSAYGGISAYNTTITINPFGDVSMNSVSPTSFYGIYRLLAIYPKGQDVVEIIGDFIIESSSIFAGATIIKNKITKIGTAIRYEFEATFAATTLYSGSDLGIHVSTDFRPQNVTYMTAYFEISGQTGTNSRSVVITKTDPAYLYIYSGNVINAVSMKFECVTTAESA